MRAIGRDQKSPHANSQSRAFFPKRHAVIRYCYDVMMEVSTNIGVSARSGGLQELSPPEYVQDRMQEK